VHVLHYITGSGPQFMEGYHTFHDGTPGPLFW